MSAPEVHCPVRAVTHGPEAHFFGYYDKSPWDSSGRYMLALEAAAVDRMPLAGETAKILLLDLETNTCDLHPRWSRDGRQVCVDSPDEHARQIVVADVSSITAPH